MVLFENIFIGQIVEVFLNGRVELGKVRYKGSIVTKKGDWVGVELQNPVGDMDGLYKARRYFFVRQNHGLLTTANKIRFPSNSRRLFNRYSCVDKESSVDTDLFDKKTVETELRLSRSFLEEALNSNVIWSRESNRYPLNHPVGNTIPPGKSDSRSKRCKSTPPTRISNTYRVVRGLDSSHSEFFISPPSIPECHMPREAELHQIKEGWDGIHFPRHHQSYLLRDSMHASDDWWNNIDL